MGNKSSIETNNKIISKPIMLYSEEDKGINDQIEIKHPKIIIKEDKSFVFDIRLYSRGMTQYLITETGNIFQISFKDDIKNEYVLNLIEGEGISCVWVNNITTINIFVRRLFKFNANKLHLKLRLSGSRIVSFIIETGMNIDKDLLNSNFVEI